MNYNNNILLKNDYLYSTTQRVLKPEDQQQPLFIQKSLPLNIATPLPAKEDTILDSNGNSPLTCAVFSNDFPTARNLVELHHLPLNLQNFEGETPLSYAVMNSNYDMTKFLLSRGADLNISNCRAESPLHQAVAIGNIEISRLLVEGGSYLDSEDECGETPLHFAVREDQAEIVEFLLSIGADPDHSNNDDETPAELAEMVASEAVKKVFFGLL